MLARQRSNSVSLSSSDGQSQDYSRVSVNGKVDEIVAILWGLYYLMIGIYMIDLY